MTADWLEPNSVLVLVREYLGCERRLEELERAILAEPKLLRRINWITHPDQLVETYQIRINRWLGGDGPVLEGGPEFVRALENMGGRTGLLTVQGEGANWLLLVDACVPTLLAVLGIHPEKEGEA